MASAMASRLGYGIRCPACGAEPGEGCRGEDGKPQAAYVHTRRVKL